MPDAKIKGSCLCQAVRFEIAPPVTGFRYCHCSRCRKASGAAHAANIFLPANQLTWLSGEDAITRYSLPGAQRFAVWFCKHCGTRVPHRIPTRDDYLVPAGVLDGDPGKQPENSIFWTSRAPWYVEPHEHTQYPEYPA